MNDTLNQRKQTERQRRVVRHRCQRCGAHGKGYYSPSGACRECNHRAKAPTPSQVRNLSEVERAWIGGLFEGEGCVGDYGRCRYSLRLTSTEIETISTVFRLVGQGTIVYRSRKRPLKDAWSWSISSARSIIHLGNQILPYLTSKQDQMEALVDRLTAIHGAN